MNQSNKERWHNALPQPVGFVFSGGAAQGALQVGMLQALLEAGIQPDLVVGASVGTLNAAVVAKAGLEAGVQTKIRLGYETTAEFLRKADIPKPGKMSGAPHMHGGRPVEIARTARASSA